MGPTAPQTKTDIVSMLRAEGFRPNRRRGQNFLVDGNLMRLVVQSAEIGPEDFVLEVGTGTGSLTRMLAAGAGEVLTVEVDPMLQRVSARVLEGLANVRRVEADVLEGKREVHPLVVEALRAAASRQAHIKLVANLPYSIATPLVMNLITGDVEFERMVFTVQHEVAERLVAEPGSAAYGWASVVIALAGRAKIVRRFPPSVFWPRPAVESSLVVFLPTPGWKQGIDLERLRDVGQFIFQQQRKVAARILRDYLKRRGLALSPEGVLASAGINASARGHRIRPQEILRLSRLIP